MKYSFYKGIFTSEPKRIKQAELVFQMCGFLDASKSIENWT